MASVIRDIAPVFEFLRGVWDAFPAIVKVLTVSSFGGVVYIAVLKSIWR